MPLGSTAVKGAASKRKRATTAARALEVRVKKLERLLAARTRELEEATARRQAESETHRQLERSVESKDAFLAALIHQLRNPLNAIVGWSHLLRDEQLDAQSTARGLDTICRNAELQGQIISDLLDAWQTISGGIQPDTDPVDLVALLKTVVDRIRPVAEAKQLQLEMDLAADAAAIHGDSGRLQHILASLLSNAVKITSPGGRVDVSLTTENDVAEVVVRRDDSAIAGGAGEVESAKPGALADDGGTLSNAVARHFVELHGGTLEASPDRNGRAVRLRLPVAPGVRAD
jgi:signal transduction histidine kinase